MNTLNINKIGWLFVLSLFCLLIVSSLVQKGMFLDGITYAAVSNNLANGVGGFFYPHYTKTWYNEFYMQPPLVFGMQSLFFKLFGSSFIVERLYSLTMAMLTILVIVLNWKLFTKEFNFKTFSWLPILFWVITPIIFWSYQNNMIENTLSVFSLFSIYFITKGLKFNNLFYLLLGSSIILLCFLTKGLVGLFPLSAVFIYAITFRQLKFGKTVFLSLLILLVPTALFYILTLLDDGFKQNLMLYIDNQIIPSLNNKREITTNNRFWILGRLLMELSAPLVASIFLFFYYKKSPKQLRTGVYFILIGLSASLPLMITHQQRGYYLVMSLSFYIIGLSIFIAPFVFELINRLSKRSISLIRVSTIVVLTFSILFCICKFGDYKRDKNRIQDIEKISTLVGKRTIISCSKSLYENWGSIAYLSRIANISVDTKPHNYFLMDKNEELIHAPYYFRESYEEVDLELNSYKIYKKKLNTKF